MNILHFIHTAINITGKDKNQRISDLIQSEYNDDIDKLMRIVFDDNTIFGIDAIDPIYNNKLEPYIDFDPIFTLMNNLVSGYPSNKERNEDIKRVLSLYNMIEQEIIINILKKKPRFGFTQKLLNKDICSMGYEPISQFSCMKASKLKTEFEYIDLLNKRVNYIETKYDGERLIAFVNIETNTVEYKTRNGLNSIMTCDNITKELLIFAKQFNGSANIIVIDGEKYANDYSSTMKSKKTGADMSNISYKIFFAMNIKDWNRKHCDMALSVFLHIAKPIMQQPFTNISLTEGKLVSSYDEALSIYQTILDSGGEGCMIKNYHGYYQWSRSPLWIKWVPKISFDGVIIEILPGDIGSAYEISCGRIKIVGVDESGDHIETYVGSGFSDELRTSLYVNKEEYIGRMVQIEARSYSIDSKTKIKSLRFPTFQKFRDDK
jgi:ATP-dependent DNA ligase